jgi:hypothetical protein
MRVPWAEAIGLHDVAELDVDHETRTHQLVIEAETLDVDARGMQTLACGLVGALLPLLGVVVHEGVVHVEPDRANRAQVEGAIAEQASLGRDGGGRKQQHGLRRA